MKNLILGFVAMMLLSACSQNDANVSGTLINGEGEMAILERLSSTDVTATDSAKINANGEFSVSTGEITGPGFYRLRVGENNYVILLLNQGEKVNLQGNALDFYRSYEISGSPDSEKLRMLDQRLRKDYELTDSLRKSFMDLQTAGIYNMDSVKQSIDQIFLDAQTKKADFVKQFISENSNSLATLSAVQSLKYDEYSELFDQVVTNLEGVYPNSDYVKQFKKQLVDLKAKQQASSRTQEGVEAPEIVLETPDGQPIKLSDFRGKVTLIDFWAAWCKPCRMENPNVVRLYNLYNDKGFEVFGVSLDKDKEAWINAIKQDGLVWKHGSDLQFWNSSVVPAYNLNGIPMTYLVDENGVIIAKGLRGKQLEDTLKEIFG